MKAQELFCLALFFLFTFNLNAMNQNQSTEPGDSLVVLWTSGDKEVATKMVFMYTYNAKKQGWWDHVTLIIWGPSAKLLSEDKELQDYVRKMQDEGIVTEACIACARMYGVDQKLLELDIDVKGMGVPLTEYKKSGRHLMTF